MALLFELVLEESHQRLVCVMTARDPEVRLLLGHRQRSVRVVHHDRADSNGLAGRRALHAEPALSVHEHVHCAYADRLAGQELRCGGVVHDCKPEVRAFHSHLLGQVRVRSDVESRTDALVETRLKDQQASDRLATTGVRLDYEVSLLPPARPLVENRLLDCAEIAIPLSLVGESVEQDCGVGDRRQCSRASDLLEVKGQGDSPSASGWTSLRSGLLDEQQIRGRGMRWRRSLKVEVSRERRALPSGPLACRRRSSRGQLGKRPRRVGSRARPAPVDPSGVAPIAGQRRAARVAMVVERAALNRRSCERPTSSEA